MTQKPTTNKKLKRVVVGGNTSLPPPHLRNKPKPTKVVESFGDVVIDQSVRRRINALINVTHHLADVMDHIITAANAELRAIDDYYRLELSHSVDIIKRHTTSMVRTVDTLCSPEYQEKFGDIGDVLLKHVLEFFENYKPPTQ